MVVLELPLPEAVSVEVETSTLLGAGGWHPKAAASIMTERQEKIIRHSFTAKVLLARGGNGFISI